MMWELICRPSQGGSTPAATPCDKDFLLARPSPPEKRNKNFPLKQLKQDPIFPFKIEEAMRWPKTHELHMISFFNALFKVSWMHNAKVNIVKICCCIFHEGDVFWEFVACRNKSRGK